MIFCLVSFWIFPASHISNTSAEPIASLLRLLLDLALDPFLLYQPLQLHRQTPLMSLSQLPQSFIQPLELKFRRMNLVHDNRTNLLEC